MAEFVQQLVNGLILGGVYVLVALGVSLVFGLTRFVNFAHGEFFALGAMLTWVLTEHGQPFWLAALLAIAATGAVAAILERIVFRPTLSVPINGFIISLGLISIMQALMAMQFGDEPRTVPSPVTGMVQIGSILIPWDALFITGVTLALAVCLIVVLDRTRVGREVRATSEDAYAATLVGISSAGVIALVFAAGSALAAAGGALIITAYALTPFSGLLFVLKGFIVAIIGGLGNMRGCVIVGFGLGAAEAMTGAYISLAWQGAIAYVVLIVVLAFKPTGLLRGSVA